MSVEKEDRYYESTEELLQQAETGIGVPFGTLDKTGRIDTLRNKGKLGQIVEEALFDIQINNRHEPDIPNLGVELKTTPIKRNKNGTISAKERTVLTIIDYVNENWNSFYDTDLWYKCAKMLFLFYDGTKDERSVKEYCLLKNWFFEWMEEDMPTILDDYKRIADKVKAGKADELSESDGNYLSCCTKGSGHEKDYRKQPFSNIEAKQRAWELKPSYMTMLLRTYVFNQDEIEHIVKEQTQLPFTKIIENKLNQYKGKSEEELCKEFSVNKNSKQALSSVVRKMLGLNKDLDHSVEFKKANMNLRVIRIKYNGMPKEDNPFKCYVFRDVIKTEWEDSPVKTEIIDKRFMYVFFKASDKKNTTYCLDKVVFWGFPDALIDEAHRVWDETINIIKDGVQLELQKKDDKVKVCTNFPTSKVNRVIFTKIHASQTCYEIEPDKFIGKGSLSDTDVLPDGRRITKHSFWFPKAFIKYIYDEKEQWSDFLK